MDPSGLIMRLNTYSPWKDHLYSLEKELGVEKPILYCLVRFLFLLALSKGKEFRLYFGFK